MGIKAGKIWGNTELVHANGVLEFHRIEYKAGYKCSEHEHQFKWNGFFVESGEMLIRVWQDGAQEGAAAQAAARRRDADARARRALAARAAEGAGGRPAEGVGRGRRGDRRQA